MKCLYINGGFYYQWNIKISDCYFIVGYIPNSICWNSSTLLYVWETSRASLWFSCNLIQNGFRWFWSVQCEKKSPRKGLYRIHRLFRQGACKYLFIFIPCIVTEIAVTIMSADKILENLEAYVWAYLSELWLDSSFH